MNKIIEAQKTGILVDWGEEMIIFKGDESEALNNMLDHDRDNHWQRVEDVYDRPYYLTCYKIKGVWVAVRDYEYAEITINKDLLHDVGEWVEMEEN